MKKQLNTAAMENELKSGSAFFQQPANRQDSVEEKIPTPLPSPPEITKTNAPRIKQPEPEIEVSHPVNQSIDQSVDQSTKQLTGKVVDRPVAFYIPEVINKKIDEAVQYYEDEHRMKFDRSAVVSAILGDPKIWTGKALDQLTSKVTEQLTSRLTGRLTGR